MVVSRIQIVTEKNKDSVVGDGSGSIVYYICAHKGASGTEIWAPVLEITWALA